MLPSPPFSPPPPTLPSALTLAAEFGQLIVRVYPRIRPRDHDLLVLGFSKGYGGEVEPLDTQRQAVYERQAAHLSWHLGYFVFSRFPSPLTDELSPTIQVVNSFRAGLSSPKRH